MERHPHYREEKKKGMRGQGEVKRTERGKEEEEEKSKRKRKEEKRKEEEEKMKRKCSVGKTDDESKSLA